MKHEMKRGEPAKNPDDAGDADNFEAVATPSVWAIAIVIDRDKSKAANRLEFNKLGGGTGTLDVERGRVGRPSDIVAELKTAGAILPPLPKDAASVDVTAAMNAVPGRTIVKVFRGGWQDQCSGFARPNWHLGSKEYVWGNPHDCPAPPSRGTAKAWRDGLAPACSKSAYLSFAVGTAFSGVLLEFLDEQEGATFHFSGRSSRGKTLSLRAAQSVFHRADVVDVEPASATSKRIEEYCHARNSAVLLLDEHGRQKGTKSERAERQRTDAYKVASGRGDGVSAAVRDLLPDLRWHTLALSSGEDPLDADAEARKGGEKVRHIDIPVPAHAVGIFNRVSTKQGAGEASKNGAALAAQVEATISANFDVAFQPYVRWLLENAVEAKRDARKSIDSFIGRVGATQDPYHTRLARKFGIVLAGMLLAVEAGVAPWNGKRARLAARHLYNLALSQITTDDDRSNAALLAIRDKVSDGSIVAIKKGQGVKANAVGFIRSVDGQKLVCVDPKFLEQHFHRSSIPVSVLKTWLSDQLLIRDTAKEIWKRQVKVIVGQKSTKSYWYMFYLDALMADNKSTDPH